MRLLEGSEGMDFIDLKVENQKSQEEEGKSIAAYDKITHEVERMRVKFEPSDCSGEFIAAIFFFFCAVRAAEGKTPPPVETLEQAQTLLLLSAKVSRLLSSSRLCL